MWIETSWFQRKEAGIPSCLYFFSYGWHPIDEEIKSHPHGVSLRLKTVKLCGRSDSDWSLHCHVSKLLAKALFVSVFFRICDFQNSRNHFQISRIHSVAKLLNQSLLAQQWSFTAWAPALASWTSKHPTLRQQTSCGTSDFCIQYMI